MKFYIRTLGCKMNALDSARIGAVLQSAGHQPAASEAEAEWVLVNTCTVTAEADRKSGRQVRGAVREGRRVAVLGCGPRVDAGKWQAQAPDGQVFEDETALYASLGITSTSLPFPLTSRTRLPVAIQTGCDNQCSFCITRIARGRHHTVPAEQVIANIRAAEAAGIREVVLTGINLAAWGAEQSTRAGQARLHALLAAILRETEIPRIRLSSLGPQYLHAGFFDVFNEPRLCAYLHLSLQSGSAGVLWRMARDHGTEEVERIAEQARAVRPEVALAADIITGFPAESDVEHAESVAFVERIGFSKLHVFPFSERQDTPAAAMPGTIPRPLRAARATELRDLGRRLRRRFVEGQFGSRFMVLAEGNEAGLTGNYIRLKLPGTPAGSLHEIEVSPATLAERL